MLFVNSFATPLAAAFVIATACNAAWLFGAALPANPAVVLPTPPAKDADGSVVDRYYRSIDEGELANSKHMAPIETAAAIEATVAGTIVLILIARRIN